MAIFGENPGERAPGEKLQKIESALPIESTFPDACGPPVFRANKSDETDRPFRQAGGRKKRPTFEHSDIFFYFCRTEEPELTEIK